MEDQKSDSSLAVLTQNYPTRLKQASSNDKITFRSGKSWATAESEVNTHGSMTVYFRTVTEDDHEYISHTGTITDIVTHPEEHPDKARELRDHLPEDDDYLEYNDPPATLYLVTDIKTLNENEQFSQTELTKRDTTAIAQNYRRGYAIVNKN